MLHYTWPVKEYNVIRIEMMQKWLDGFTMLNPMIFVEKLRNTLHIDMTKERLQNSTWLEIHRIDSLVQQNSKARG